MNDMSKMIERKRRIDEAVMRATLVVTVCVGFLFTAIVSARRGCELSKEREAHAETKKNLHMAEQDAKDAAIRLNEALATLAALRGTIE